MTPASGTLAAAAVSLIAISATVTSPAAQAPPDVLSRIRAYVERFQQELPSLVAEENYVQAVTATMSSNKRVLRSDVLMVSVPGIAGWVSFRDVFEVDGRQLRDREDRLLKLLQSPGTDGLAQARKLAEESARFNLGKVTRTTNLPDSALIYLQASSASRMKFESARPASPVDGQETVVVRFRETGRPTIVTSPRGSSVPASGQVWAHAATGAIVKTEFKLSDLASSAVFVVEFALDERLGLRLPVKMTEHYSSTNEEVRATAQYTNVRRFNVATNETLRKPPG
jgi:hypothetical protein